MFDYARKMQLAVSDVGRRAGLKAGAAVAALVAAGFLLAALWTFIDSTLGWGPLWASLIIGLLFLLVAGVVYSMSKTVKHPVPTTQELKHEVEARVSLAADVALNKARQTAEDAMDAARDKAFEVVDRAGNKVVALMDTASERAASIADNAEARVQRFASSTIGTAEQRVHDVVGTAASTIGLTPRFFSEAHAFTDKVKGARTMPAASLLGAFAVGMTLASRLQAMRRHDDDDWDEDAWDEDGDDWPEADDADYTRA